MTAPLVEAPAPAKTAVPPLENGDFLTATEFLRRYEAMPELKKAELIDGRVFIPMPVRYTQHAKPDSHVQGWLYHYAINTPGVESATNSTVIFDEESVPQPDALLRITSECGGQSRPNPDGYLVGAPELIVEVAASSASLDLHDKLRAYRRNRVREYLVWRTLERQFDWFVLEADEYVRLAPDPEGNISSRLFPGLVLAVPALLKLDGSQVIRVLDSHLRTPEHQAFIERLQSARSGV